MAPTSPSQKRKRGRPPSASRLDADASQSRNVVAEEYDADADEGTRAKKRGRPRTNIKTTEVAPDLPTAPQPSRGRRPQAKGDRSEGAVSVNAQEEESSTRTKRKRGRPSLNNTGAETEDKSGGGPSQQETQAVPVISLEQEHQGSEMQPSPQRKRRRRPTEKRGEAEKDAQEQAVQPEEQPQPGEQQPKRRKRGRQSLQDVLPSEAQNKGAATGKSGRSRKQNETNGDGNSNEKKKQKGRKQQRRSLGEEANSRPRSRAEAVTSPANRADTSQGQAQKRRRASPNPDAEDDDFPPSPLKPYPHIAPRVRRIRQSVIEAKWSTLAGSALSAVSLTLQLAHRPILQRLSNTQQRRDFTSAALRLITHRINRKISRGLPFPPASMITRRPRGGKGADESDSGRAAELDFESVLDAKQALERQLDPALHAVELLAREKGRMEKELERDYETLRNLESSARGQAREVRGLLKKAHVLAPVPEAGGESHRGERLERKLLFTPNDEAAASAGLFHDLEDEETKSLALQLGGHIESIRNNLQQTDGVIGEMARSRAALRGVLSKHVNQAQYEHVVLGPAAR